jgi:hypothetical protein
MNLRPIPPNVHIKKNWLDFLTENSKLYKAVNILTRFSAEA